MKGRRPHGLFGGTAMLAAGLFCPGAMAQTTDAAANSGAASTSAPITDPKLLREKPRYVSGTMPDTLPISEQMAAQGRYGTVLASATVTTEGGLEDIILVAPSGVADLDAAIIAALGNWRLSPARGLDGTKVSAQASFPFAIGALPKRVAGREPEFPAAAKAAGHNGAVVASAVIGVDGMLTDIVVAQSSGSQILDGSVTTALSEWRYTAPRDLRGEPAAVPLSLKFNFTQAEAGTGSYLAGLRSYRCDAFIREIDWWTSAHPGAETSDLEFHKFVGGVRFAAPETVIKGYSPKTTDRVTVIRGHKPAWDHAIERCRAAPGSTFLEEYRKG